MRLNTPLCLVDETAITVESSTRASQIQAELLFRIADSPIMSILDRLNYLLARRGVPEREIKSELAATCGLSYEAVRKWFIGDTALGAIKSENLIAIARRYRTTTDWLLMGKGSMDDINPMAARLGIGEKSAQDLVYIQMFDVGESSGVGRVLPDGYLQIIAGLIVSEEWLRRINCTITHPENLAIITSDDDSMSSTYESGDALLIDRGIKEMQGDAVYVFALEGKVLIKRLQRMPGNVIRVISDNQRYHAYDITAELMGGFRVLARVLLAFNTRKL